MSYDDWSSRKLRRKYIRAVKDVWHYQNLGYEASARYALRTRVNNYGEELRRRGWMV